MKPRVVVTIPFTTYLAGALFSLPFRLLAAIVRVCVAVPILRYVCLAAALAGGIFTYSSYKAAHCHGDAYGFATGRNLGIACDRRRSRS
jgi:prepilin signal peptidase PulO-like enzyme (type II secretory pathway)